MSYLYKGADHHKLWHLFEILYTAIILELVYPYVKDCHDKGTVASRDSYWEWSDQAKNPNYIYMQHVAMNYLHVLMMLRAGEKTFKIFLLTTPFIGRASLLN